MHPNLMDTTDMVSPQVWNVSTSLCSACMDGRYEDCHCNNERNTYQFCKDLSTDSLDQCHINPKCKQTSSSNRENSGFIFDNEFEEGYVRPLPPSTTDWDSIDSVLENELDLPDENSDVEKTPLSRRLSQSFHMQMTFVDSEDSDKDSIPDVEVYYDDDVENLRYTSGSQDNLSFENERNIDSRDSGYVTTDFDVNIERVTDSQKRRASIEPVEASTRVLASLHLHEEHEIKKCQEIKKQKQQDYENATEIHRKNVEELHHMKETLELRIAQINMELVEGLQLRDKLNSHHEALLMDADDLAQSSNPNTPTKTSMTNQSTKKRFWKR